jgi:hypothetical protein
MTTPMPYQGSENCLLDGDSQSEHLLSEIVGVQPYKGVRHANMESLYEYGSRAGSSCPPPPSHPTIFFPLPSPRCLPLKTRADQKSPHPAGFLRIDLLCSHFTLPYESKAT